MRSMQLPSLRLPVIFCVFEDLIMSYSQLLYLVSLCSSLAITLGVSVDDISCRFYQDEVVLSYGDRQWRYLYSDF